MSGIYGNYCDVRSRMESACARSGRGAGDVRLIAVTKFVDIPRIAEAVTAGVTEVGENRVQDLKEKLNFFEQHGLTTHFIGQLQTNKLKYVCNRVGTIQSVDRAALCEKLEQAAAANGGVQDVFVQVNIGDEPQKGGISIPELPSLVGILSECSHLCVKGLMCVPPAGEPEAARPYFRRMYELFCRLRREYPKLPIAELSMGMSHDFEVAIEEGATMVRVGTAIFGERTK